MTALDAVDASSAGNAAVKTVLGEASVRKACVGAPLKA